MHPRNISHSRSNTSALYLSTRRLSTWFPGDFRNFDKGSDINLHTSNALRCHLYLLVVLFSLRADFAR
ncbi:hypothetical protein Y032_0058g2845 [Ancylostoma ceylanicum]|uniref:Uncharacterized protein n=1 Tax=Ancylostoma ceylanicum TaxID=53326 RepID=A0A016U4R4_9BILA|nr:hypothetical protein Y032_0058g2845 [Ancylostoma ceylanicum]